MERLFNMHLHIIFPMKAGETKEEAEDRVLEALEAVDENYSASWDESYIEEFEEEQHANQA